MKESWRTMNIAVSDTTTPANFDLNETRRLRTTEAMQRLGVEGTQLWNRKEAVKCSDVGLDSDFNYLVDVVSEDMLRAAVERKAGGLTMAGYGSTVQPSLFLDHQVSKPPEYWVEVGSRLFESCGIAAGDLEIYVLCSELMRVVVPYERSRNAASDKKRDPVLKSKAIFERVNRYRKMEEAFRNCDLIDYDKMVTEFRHL